MYWIDGKYNLTEAEDIDFLAGEEELQVLPDWAEYIPPLLRKSCFDITDTYTNDKQWVLYTHDEGIIFVNKYHMKKPSIRVTFWSGSEDGEKILRTLRSHVKEPDFEDVMNTLHNTIKDRQSLNEAEDIDFIAGEELIEPEDFVEYVVSQVEYVDLDTIYMSGWVDDEEYEYADSQEVIITTKDGGEFTLIFNLEGDYLYTRDSSDLTPQAKSLHAYIMQEIEKGNVYWTDFDDINSIVMYQESTKRITEAEDYDFMAGEEELWDLDSRVLSEIAFINIGTLHYYDDRGELIEYYRVILTTKDGGLIDLDFNAEGKSIDMSADASKTHSSPFYRYLWDMFNNFTLEDFKRIRDKKYNLKEAEDIDFLSDEGLEMWGKNLEYYITSEIEYISINDIVGDDDIEYIGVTLHGKEESDVKEIGLVFNDQGEPVDMWSGDSSSFESELHKYLDDNFEHLIVTNFMNLKKKHNL